MVPEIPAVSAEEIASVADDLRMPSALLFYTPSHGLTAPASEPEHAAPGATPQAPFSEVSYTAVEIVQLRDCLRESFALMQDIHRKWGPDQILSHCSHTSEVGMLLILARCPVEVVVAGFLHDVFEGYIKGEVADRRKHVQDVFGAEVYRLIDAVTEPPKSAAADNWKNRKAVVLENLANGDDRVAMICCAIKTSTLSEGNEFLLRGGKITEWSAGSAQENLELYEKYEAEFVRKGVPACLIDQYRLELGQLKLLLTAALPD
jgi:hypothetical protein